MNFGKPIFACAACVSTFFLVGMTVAPAFAAERVTVTAERVPLQAPTKIVRYGDLNLASAAGEKARVRRVGGAVREVCQPYGNSFEDHLIIRSCKSYAWQGARPQIASAIQRARFNGSSLAAASLTISIAGR